MNFRISQIKNGQALGMTGLCTRVYGVGIGPSTMNRFMLSNWREVLFVT
jgi:hypothetical protein